MGGVSGLAVGISDVDAALPGIEAHPHARAVLGSGLAPGGRPSHAYLLHGPAGAGKRRIARGLAAMLLADGIGDEATARAVRERVQRGAHPDLTWVRPSGAAEMLVSDIDAPVVAAATRTPFEARRRVFVIEAVETLNEQAANRLLKTLEEPPAYAHLVLVSDRREEVMATIASRCVHVRFDALAAEAIAQGWSRRGVRRRMTARACARLALGDAGRARALASEEGRALRRASEGYVRSALAGETGARKWVELLGAASGGGGGRGRAGGRAAGAGARAGAEQGAQKTGAGGAGGAPAGRAQGARAGAGSRAAAGRAVAARHDLRAARARGSWCMRWTGSVSWKRTLWRTVATARAGVELVRETRARIALNVGEELALEALAYRLQAPAAG